MTKTFGNLVNKVQLEEAKISAEVIREYFENFVIEIGLELRKIEERELVVFVSDNIELEDDIISVLEVYLDGVLMKPMSWEDYKTSRYSSNEYCYINNSDRKIYFPGDLDGTEELKVLAVVSIDSVEDLTPATELDIPNHYFMLAVYYILKEVFHTSKFFNENEIIRFERKYADMLDKIKSNPVDVKRKSEMEQLKNYNLEYD